MKTTETVCADPSFWQELEELIQSRLTLKQKYTAAYQLLDRLCIELVAPLPAHYNGLFSRLQALCRINSLPLTHIDLMRYRARQVKLGRQEPSEKEFLSDMKALSVALEHFTNIPIPASLSSLLPDSFAPTPRRMTLENKGIRLRMLAQTKDEHYIYALSAQLPATEPVRVDFTSTDHTRAAAALIERDVQFNVVSYIRDGEGVIHPTWIIVEPDMLIDISALTASVAVYGSHPLNYLLRKFESPVPTCHTLLGNMAGQFLDDCVNLPDPDFRQSLQQAFHSAALDYCTTPGIDAQFFAEAERQFRHILKTVQQLAAQHNQSSVVLEPSFFCETLGLQGRFDYLTTDHSVLLEQKAGKWDEFRGQVRHHHLLQMMLYKEVLYYNLGVRRDNCVGYLYYSKYPYLLEQRTVPQMVGEALSLRNRIVRMERWLAANPADEILLHLTPERLLENKSISPVLWHSFCRPRIDAILQTIRQADPLARDYFFTFLQFVEREQMVAKVGTGRIESTRGMASLWNADIDQKSLDGDILTDLRLASSSSLQPPVVSISLTVPHEQIGFSNFRQGDAVVLYPRMHDTDRVTNQQVLRCRVEKCEGNGISLRLRHPQRNLHLLTANTRFALEHDYVESSFRTLYAGIYALLCAPVSRRQLLLQQRQPSPESDFQLIIGPPGTGKTSVTLRRLVEQYAHQGLRQLLAAYTNRAVGEICMMLESAGLDYILMASESACPPAFLHRLFSTQVSGLQNRTQVEALLRRCRILVGTVSTLSARTNLFSLLRFDVALFDEASQLLEPQLLPLLCAACPDGQPAIGRFILIGDHKQLPAVVLQDEAQTEVSRPALRSIGLINCRDSLFQRLHRWVKDRPGFLTLLDRQGRMHPDIAHFASITFYGGQLRPVPLAHQLEPSDPAHRFVFVDVPAPSSDERQPKINHSEAFCIARIVSYLVRSSAVAHQPLDLPSQLGIIVPYRRQGAAVRSAMQQAGIQDSDHVLIDTVERYQGSQRDIIIFGTTISRPYELDILCATTLIDGVLTDRRLNVAVTRARRQLYVVGCRDLLRRNPLYARLISLATPADFTDFADPKSADP